MVDASLEQGEKPFSGNNLWAIAVNLLSNSHVVKKHGDGDDVN